MPFPKKKETRETVTILLFKKILQQSKTAFPEVSKL